MENMNNKIAVKYLALRDWAKKNGFSTRTFLKEIRFLNSVKLFLDTKIIEFFGDKHDIFGSKISKYKIEDLEFLMKRYNIVFNTYSITAIPIEDYEKYSLLKNFGSKSVLIYIRGKQENILKILNNNIEESFAIVGSRKTPEIYSKWIEERMPNKNIVISGLANGADLMGHRAAIKFKKLIVVFPGFNIDWNPPIKKMDVFNEALNNGLVISSIPPFAPFSPGMLQTRNEQMASLTSEGYVLYMKNKSGTYGYIKKMISDNKNIFLPKNIYRDNLEFMKIELKNIYLNNIVELG